MNSRISQIEALLRAVREAAPQERGKLLQAAAPEVRGEVESLLAHAGVADAALNLPPFDAITRTILSSGTMLGPYRVEGPLGAGGMGQVFRATDTRLNRAVAIKVSNQQWNDRFHREALAVSALNHPHVCTLYDVGPDYLVIELVEGETLAARLKRGPLSRGDVIRYGAQIADAVAAAHAKGIVHRDLKPGNIMLAKAGVKVLDFGLARGWRDETLTAPGAVMGTPAYMAPEQREGSRCDARTDIFALGLVLAEMANGKRGRAVPPWLAFAVEPCAAENPEERWQSAADVRIALLRAPAEFVPAPAARTPPWAVLILAGVALIALGGVWEESEGRAPAPRAVRFALSIEEIAKNI